MTLIRQNVDIKCESDRPDYIHAQAEVSEIEGYFCNLKFLRPSKMDYKDVPSKAKITVSVSATRKQGTRKELQY